MTLLKEATYIKVKASWLVKPNFQAVLGRYYCMKNLWKYNEVCVGNIHDELGEATITFFRKVSIIYYHL